MKKRDTRRKVYVPARMRHGAAWDDVRVLDVSPGGFLLQARQVPQRGTYIELCRGRKSFVARVVWTGKQRFGVSTRDRVAVDSFVDPAKKEPEPPPPDAAEQRVAENRRTESRAQQFENSRQRARALEFGSMIGAGACMALFVALLLYQALATPLRMVTAALGRN